MRLRQARPRSRWARLRRQAEDGARGMFFPHEWTVLAFCWGLAIAAAALYRP